MCLYPKLIINPKYKPNKKNGGKAPPLKDERIKYVPIGCKKCMECKKQKANSWRTRIMEDIKFYNNAKFITLTFSNENIKTITEKIKEECQKTNTEIPNDYELDNSIATYAVRHFLERWRKKYKRSLRHWLVTELGHNGTENIHLHGLIWTDISLDAVEATWQYGFMWKGHFKNGQYQNYVNDRTINYMIKYVTKIDAIHPNYNPIILTSAGIGNNYTRNPTGDWNKNKFKEGETKETYRTSSGHKTALPIYYRNKIYTEEQKEKLWIEKLDKEERYVLGNKISVKNGQEQYERALKYAQEQNKELGYGNDQQTWQQEQYERQRRIIMQKARINKTNG